MGSDSERHERRGDAFEEALHLYMDGVLPLDEQPGLFRHLAGCEACRRLMDTVMEFRRLSREDIYTVPDEVDRAIFEELNRATTRKRQRDRYWERRPLWQARGTVSLRTGMLAAALLFGAGMLFPHDAGILPAGVASTAVAYEPPPATAEVGNVLYVITPGLTIEASQTDE